MKRYTPTDWYWIVAGSTTQVYASHPSIRNFVPVSDTAYAAWSADGTLPTSIATEAELGAVLAPYMLRPVPPGVLNGYLDEQMRQFVLRPEFKVILDVYTELLHPTPSETQVRARIRSKL